MNHLLVWDIDGTLIQGKGIGKRGMDQAFLELYGIQNGFDGIDMAGMLDCNILKSAYALHKITHRDSKEYFRVYCKCLEAEISRLDSSIDAPGILPLLEILHQRENFYNTLGTGNIKGASALKLSVHDMNKYFACGGFGEEFEERWQVIREAIDCARRVFQIEFDAKNIYVIGDTPRDIDCGKRLRVKTVGVATGFFSVEQLIACGADYVFRDLTDSEAFLRIFE